MNRSIVRKFLSVCLALAMTLSVVVVAIPMTASAVGPKTAADLKGKYAVKLDYSFDEYNGILHQINLDFIGKQRNGTGKAGKIWSANRALLYFKASDAGSGTHYDGKTSAFPTLVSAKAIRYTGNVNLYKDTIKYVITVRDYDDDVDVKITGKITFNKFNKTYKFVVDKKFLPKIDSAFISLDKSEVTVSNKDQVITPSTVFGDQYGVKWKAAAKYKYSIVDDDGNEISIPGVSVVNRKVVVTDAAATADATDRQFRVKVTASNGASAVSDPVTIKTPTFSATFKYKDEELGRVKYVYGASKLDQSLVDLVPLPEEEGCTFAWGSYELNNDNDTVVYAVRNPSEYTATFIVDGTVVSEQKFTVDTKDQVIDPDLADYQKAGYSVKWKGYTLGAADIEIEAEYTAIVYKATFLLEGFQIGDQVEFTVESKKADVDALAPELPELPGFICNGWEDYEIVADDIFINANEYTLIDYKVTFLAEDGTVIDDTLTYNFLSEALSGSEPEVPAKAGHIGVWEDYDLTGIGDIVVKPDYTPINYKVDFVVDETVIKTENVPYGKGATAPLVLDKADFTFDGWDVSFDKITGPTIVTGKWKPLPIVTIKDATPVSSVPEEPIVEKVVNTADTTDIAVWAVVAGAALAGTTIIKKKKHD